MTNFLSHNADLRAFLSFGLDKIAMFWVSSWFSFFLSLFLFWYPKLGFQVIFIFLILALVNNLFILICPPKHNSEAKYFFKCIWQCWGASNMGRKLKRSIRWAPHLPKDVSYSQERGQSQAEGHTLLCWVDKGLLSSWYCQGRGNSQGSGLWCQYMVPKLPMNRGSLQDTRRI